MFSRQCYSNILKLTLCIDFGTKTGRRVRVENLDTCGKVRHFTSMIIEVVLLNILFTLFFYKQTRFEISI